MNEEWKSIYVDNVDDITRFLVFFIGNREDAEDIRQETFIRAFKNWKQFNHRSSVKTWLLSIARNLAVDRARKNHRTRILQQMLKMQPSEESFLPDEMLNLNEQKSALYKAILQLPIHYRTVIILRGIQEYTPTEVSAILGISNEKVNMNYHRALKSLKKIINRGDVFHELISRGNSN